MYMCSLAGYETPVVAEVCQPHLLGNLRDDMQSTCLHAGQRCGGYVRWRKVIPKVFITNITNLLQVLLRRPQSRRRDGIRRPPTLVPDHL